MDTPISKINKHPTCQPHLRSLGNLGAILGQNAWRTSQNRDVFFWDESAIVLGTSGRYITLITYITYFHPGWINSELLGEIMRGIIAKPHTAVWRGIFIQSNWLQSCPGHPQPSRCSINTELRKAVLGCQETRLEHIASLPILNLLYHDRM